MAKVVNLDPRINDNHTYLPWVVTHSIQDSSFQAHIRKFLIRLTVLYSLNRATMARYSLAWVSHTEQVCI